MATPTALPTAFVSGQILTAADQNLLRGAFRVLQVVAASTATELTRSVNTYVTTGLPASITPLYNTSKILVLATVAGCGKDSGDTSLGLKLFRGASEIAFFENKAGFTNSAASNFCGSCSTYILDAPATTAATTYDVHFTSVGNVARVIIQQNSSRSTIILAEISA